MINIDDPNWLVKLLRLSFLNEHRASLPPLALKTLQGPNATADSVLEQLEEEIKLQPQLEASLLIEAPETGPV